jgi:hypothetical protein
LAPILLQLGSAEKGPRARWSAVPMPDLTPSEPQAAQDPPPEAPEMAAVVAIHLGDAVRLRQPLRYLKTADPMPMLRPPDLVDLGEVGRVVEIRALELRAIRFRRGTFLINLSDLEPASPDG